MPDRLGALHNQLTYHVRSQRITYPFSALVGQDEMKLALLLNAVSPQVAGVLVRGEKGTAKSTAVRALQALLPPITVVEDCVFGCDPADLKHLCQSCAQRLEQGETLPQQQRLARLVQLPLGATEDRVLGTLDLERAIKDGVRQFEPGLLAAAHRGILYIDEVNLLPDHLVDALLDAATTGVNVVEREGISFTHPAQFVLIGTMNPEEGDLRPQLLDRFGLSIEVHGLKDALLRTQVVRRRIAFETDAATFREEWQAAEADWCRQIETARRLLPEVVISDHIMGLIASICMQLDVEGLRADITIYKAATALAALEGRHTVTEQDVQQVATMALAHRTRRQPFEQPGVDRAEIEHIVNEYHKQEQQPSDPDPPFSQSEHTSPQQSASKQKQQDRLSPDDRAQTPQIDPSSSPAQPSEEAQQPEQIIPPGVPTTLATLTLPRTKTQTAPTRKMLPTLQVAHSGNPRPQARGRIVSARHVTDHPSSMALAPTLRAAAPYQQRRRAEHPEHEEQRLWLERRDILEPIRQDKQGVLILFAVDASSSMAAQRRMASAKGAVLALLQRAYQQRDSVGLLQFRGTKATLLLPPTNSTDRACKLLANLPTGGRTPLASGLHLALRTFQIAQARNQQQRAILVLVTDGRANVANHDIKRAISLNPIEDAIIAAQELRNAGILSLVIDTEEGPARMGLASRLAQELGGTCVALATLEATPVANAVQAALGRTRNGR
jgi:magnesium chelatase subunit D